MFNHYYAFEVYLYCNGKFTPLKIAFEQIISSDEEETAAFSFLEALFQINIKNSHRFVPVGVICIAISCRT